jgi:hypothetical protein
MDSQAVSAELVRPKRKPGWGSSRALCVGLAVAWAVAGAGFCALAFVLSLIPELNGSSSPDPFDSIPVALNFVLGILGLCAVLLFIVSPVLLLIAGRRYLRGRPAGARRAGGWTAVGWAGIVITVMLLYQIVAAMNTDVFDPAWHALELCIGFLVVGAAMLGLVLGIPVPEAVSSSPGSAASADEP